MQLKTEQESYVSLLWCCVTTMAIMEKCNLGEEYFICQEAVNLENKCDLQVVSWVWQVEKSEHGQLGRSFDFRGPGLGHCTQNIEKKGYDEFLYLEVYQPH